MRARILYEDLSKRRPISDFDKQYICIQLEEVSDDVCGLGADTPCHILKSVCPVPSIINNLIFDISSTDAVGRINFDYIKSNEVKYKLNSRYKPEREGVYVFMLGDYLHLANHDFIERIKLQALFENPLEAIQYKTCENIIPLCNPLDEEILISERLIPILRDLIITNISNSMGFRQDVLNNQIEDQSVQQAPQR